MPGQAWTQEELDSLLRQVIAERKPLQKLSVPGKTTAAINNQRRRLKEAGLLENSFTGLRHVPWTIRELRQLARLTGEHGCQRRLHCAAAAHPGPQPTRDQQDDGPAWPRQPYHQIARAERASPDN